MKVEFIRKFKGKNIGDMEDCPDRVAHRFVNRGMAKFVKVKTRKTSKKKLQMGGTISSKKADRIFGN